MNTHTPDLDPAVLGRLRDYAALFAPDFPQSKPARWAGVYLHDLLADGDRKSVEPLSRRVDLPAGLASKAPERALQQFVSRSPWDHEAVLRRYRAHSVWGAATVLRGARQDGQLTGRRVRPLRRPAGALPAGDAALPARVVGGRRRAAGPGGVPKERRRERTKGQIALDLLDRVRAEGLPGQMVLADAGYGASGGWPTAGCTTSPG